MRKFWGWLVRSAHLAWKPFDAPIEIYHPVIEKGETKKLIFLGCSCGKVFWYDKFFEGRQISFTVTSGNFAGETITLQCGKPDPEKSEVRLTDIQDKH
jgi:hypothetical protein